VAGQRPGTGRRILAQHHRSPAADIGRGRRFSYNRAGEIGFDFQQPFDLDLHRVEAAAQVTAASEVMQAALTVNRGDFLTGFSLPDAPEFDDWATLQRELWHRRFDGIYDRLSQHQLEQGAYTQAVETAAHWVARAVVSEAAYRRLMETHFLAGDRPAALATFESCRRMLRQELGVEAAPETIALAGRIRESRPFDLAQDRSTIYEIRLRESEANRKSEIENPKLIELPLVGRNDEHSRLVTLYRQACRGETQVVAVIGEAGIGKTRLAGAFVKWAALDRLAADILTGRAFEMGGQLPYQPLVDALRFRLEQENAPEDLLPDIWLAELSQLLPELRDRYPDLPPPLTGDADFVRARLFEAIARLGRALIQRQPVILFIDDIHWADEGSLDLLQYLSRRWAQERTPVLLLITVRQELLAATPKLRDWLANIGREVPLTRLNLFPLTATATHQLITILAGAADGTERSGAQPDQPDMVRRFSDWLLAETGGHPFFMTEMLKMLQERGVLSHRQAQGRPVFDFRAALKQVESKARFPLPSTMREVILARLGRLTDTAGLLLLAGAIIGRECSFERLCQVANVPEADGLSALEELLNSRLMLEKSADRRPYSFAHDKIREVVYTEAGEARRRVYHRRALAALEGAGAPPAELAFQATAARLDEPSFRYSLAAGDEALAAYAPVEAIVHYNCAREIALRLPTNPELLCQLYTCRGRALELNNQYDEALANYEEMAKLASERGDKVLELASLTTRCIVQATQTPLYNPAEARKVSEAALVLAGELGDRATEAKVLWGLVLVEYWGGGDVRKALEYGQQSLAITRELGLKEQMGYTLSDLVHTYFGLNQVEPARRANLEARAIWQELNNIPMLADSYGSGLWIHIFLGQYEAALQSAQEARRLSQTIGNLWNDIGSLWNMGLVYLEQGKLGQAIGVMEEAVRRGTEADQPALTHGFSRYLILAYLTVGYLNQAGQLANDLYAKQDSLIKIYLPDQMGVIAQLKIVQGDLVGAERIIDEAYQQADIDSLSILLAQRIFIADAHLHLALGKPEDVLERMEYLTHRARSAGIRFYFPEVLWLLGKVLSALNKPGPAREVLREGLTVAEETIARRVWWPILWELSQLERAAGNTAEAERLRQQAREIVAYIADHAGSNELSASFLALPEVRAILSPV